MAQQYYTVSFQDSAGNPLAGGQVTFQLQQDVASGTAQICAGRRVSAVLDDTGTATVLLWSPATTTPPASYRMRAYTANGQLAFRQDNALSSSEQTLTAPTFSPATGYYYTLDGSTPTPASSFTTGTVAINSSETLQAIAVAPTYFTSPVGSARYVIAIPTPISTAYNVVSQSADPTTTPVSLDTTNASLIVVVVSGLAENSSGLSFAVTDNFGNTYSALTPNNAIPPTQPATEQIFYAFSPITGATTISVVMVSGQTISNELGVSVAAFSGTSTGDPFESGSDVSSTTYPTGSTTIQAGSITPNDANDLVFTAIFADADSATSIDSGFNLLDSPPFAFPIMAYLVVPNTNPVNPTWTYASEQLYPIVNSACFHHA